MSWNPNRNQRRVLYVVVRPGRAPLNDRVNGVLRLKHRFDKLTLVSGGSSQGYSPHLIARPLPGPTAIFRSSYLRPLRNKVERLLYFPSRHIRYVKTVARVLQPLVRADLDHGLRVTILTCAPPHAVSMIGMILKRKFAQIHWVVDWQDLWSYDENYLMQVPGIYRNRLYKLEQAIMQESDMNVTTNSYAQAVLQNRYHVPPEKTSYIHHHYDKRSQWGISDSSDKPGVTRLGFLGTLFKPPRVPGTSLIDVLRDINNSAISLELHVHGGIPVSVKNCYARDIGDWLFFHGKSTHEDSIRQISNYDVLLLYLADLDNSKVVMSIKLPAYFAAQKPILAIVPEDSANAEIIRHSGVGKIISVRSDWQASLKMSLSNWSTISNALIRNQKYIDSFTWEQIADKWADVLGSTLK